MRHAEEDNGDKRQDGRPVLARRDHVDAFVKRHFGWRGTLRLHREALGLDILRAPMNVVLSPLLVLARAAAWILRKLRMRRLGEWLMDRRLLLRTSVSARIEAAIVADLLDVPVPAANRAPDRATLARAIRSAPRFRQLIGERRNEAEAKAVTDRIMAAIGEYTGTRSAIAEFTTALFTLIAGAIAFHALTPGMISMAPGLAEAVALHRALADFPLGETLGRVWYGFFPVGPSPMLVALSVAGLLAVGSVVTTFAGMIADPVQARLGLHRRRLMRLLDTLEAEITGTPDRPFVAREHFLARAFDLWDAVLSVLRMFRG